MLRLHRNKWVLFMKTLHSLRITTFKLLFVFILFPLVNGYSQTVFWSDNFDAPSGGLENNNNGAGWVLNSEGNNGNRWFVNAPNGIGCSSSGNVLHISCSGGFCGFLGGPNEPIYNAAGSNLKTAVSPTISTIGQSNITLSFDFICEGYAGSDFGTLALSSDNGANWTDLPGVYVEVSSCSTKTITVPAQYQNISTFKMRFKWVESSSFDGVDPPFSIDNIKLTVATSSCTPPTVSAGSDVSICPGGSIAIGGSPTATGGSELGALVYSWSPTTNLSSASAANPTANPSVTTPYTVTVYRNTPSCSATATVTVTVNTPQVLTVSPSGTQTICPGGSVSLAAANGFTNYVWTTPSGTQNGQAISATAAGNYTVTAHDANTCNSTSTAVTISIATPQVLTVSPSGTQTICPGGSVSLAAANGFTNYVWTTPSGTQNGQTISATVAGNYTVTAHDANNCNSTSSSVTVSIATPQTLSVSPSGTQTICPGGSVNLAAANGFTNYVWTTPSGTQNGQTISATAAGNYTVTAHDANNCNSTSTAVTVSIATPQVLTVSPSGTQTICPGGSVSLAAVNGFTNYVWTTPSGTQNGQTISATAAGNYTVTAHDANNCNSTSTAVTVSIATPQTLSVSPSGTQTICPGGSVNLAAANGFTNYVWITPSGTQNGQTISATTAGNYTVTAHDANNCNSTSTAVVVSIATPQTLSVSPSGTQTICPGGSVSLAAANGFTNYVWTTPSGTQNGQTISAAVAGNYTVTAHDANNCNSTSAAVTVSIATPETLSVSPSGTQTICPGGSVSLSAANGFTNYVWTTPSGTQNGQTISAAVAGNYTVTAHDANNCNSTSAAVTVSIATPQVLTVSPSGTQTICPESSITLFAGNGFTNYTWTSPAGIQVGQSITTSLEGDYIVSAIGANSCLSTAATVSITFLQPQSITISPANDSSICPGSTITYAATSGLSNYSWNTPTGTISGQSITVSEAGTYSVSAIGSNSCITNSSNVNLSIQIPEILSITSSEGTTLCPGASIDLTALDGFINYQWLTPSGASSGQSISANQIGNYSVSATDLHGCHSISEQTTIIQGIIETISVNPIGPLNVCAGGSVELIAADGFTTYTWSNSEVGQNLIVTEPGIYFVNGSGLGCGGQSNNVIVTFDEPNLLDVTADGPLVLCQNDDVVLTAASGFTNYHWSNSILGISQTFSQAGNFQVSATDANGCQYTSANQIISIDPPFTISINPSGNITLCEGDEIDLQAQTGFSNYVWSNSSSGNSLTVNAEGMYSVSAQNANGCYGTSDVVSVQLVSEPNAAFTFQQIVDQYSVSFTSSTIAQNYLWNFGNNQTSTEANPVFTFPFDGNYPVTLITTNACGSDTLTQNVPVIKTAINPLNSINQLEISPNPGINYVRIKGNSSVNQEIGIKLYSSSGEIVYDQLAYVKNDFQFDIPTNHLMKGIYLIIITNGRNQVARKWLKD